MRPVVLVCLDWIRSGDPRAGLGVASIASALRAAGAAPTIVADAVNRSGFDADAFTRRVAEAAHAAGPDALVGIGAFVWNEPEVRRLVPALRANTRASIVLGGPQVSYGVRGTLDCLYPGVDAFVRGSGEDAIVALAAGHAREGQHGVHVAGVPDLGVRADVDLTVLPSPHLDGTLPIGPYVRWETQRGCMFACTFCQHREAGSRLRRTDLAVDRLRAEIDAFASANVKRISVLDPIFHADRRRAVGLLQEMKRVGLRAQLSLQCRFELVDDAFLDALDGLDVVLEFGLQTVHEDEARAVGRPNRMDLVADAIERLRARAIPFEVSLIYGLPLQTLDRFQRSVDWCFDRGVPQVRAWPLMLLRGTPLELQRARWGFVEGGDNRIPIVVASNTFTEADHERMSLVAAGLDVRRVAA
jgi:radical SAM superfamily enzyme YgiQ (UPF0313 family)